MGFGKEGKAAFPWEQPQPSAVPGDLGMGSGTQSTEQPPLTNSCVCFSLSPSLCPCLPAIHHLQNQPKTPSKGVLGTKPPHGCAQRVSPPGCSPISPCTFPPPPSPSLDTGHSQMRRSISSSSSFPSGLGAETDLYWCCCFLMPGCRSNGVIPNP